MVMAVNQEAKEPQKKTVLNHSPQLESALNTPQNQNSPAPLLPAPYSPSIHPHDCAIPLPDRAEKLSTEPLKWGLLLP